jgi:hypothetical protein
MTRLSWLFLIALSLAACKRKPQDDPATTRPSDARPLPDRGTAEVLPAQQVTPVGTPLAADPALPAGAPAVEVDADGKPVVAWIEGGMVHVRRWDGAAWLPLGEAVNKATHQARGVPVLAREDQGLVLGWIEPGAAKLDAVQVARWKDGAWTALGSPSTPTAPALDLAVAWADVGPVAVWREGTAARATVHVSVRGAKGWAPLGTGTLEGAPDATAHVAPALATRAGGPVVVGWVEKSPAPTLHVRRWNRTTSTWDTLPAPPGADGNGTLSMAATSDGALHAALGYTVGLRQLATFLPGAMEWTKIGVPESANGQVLEQRVTAGDDGRLLFTYPFGGRYAYWDGKRWSPTSVGVKSPSTVVPAAAGAADGKVYVAWSDSPPGSTEPDRVRVFVVE